MKTKIGLICLIHFFVVSSSQRIHSSSSNYFLDPLRLLGIDQERVEKTALSIGESSLRGFWNSSWPSIAGKWIEERSQLGVGPPPLEGNGVGSFNISLNCREDLVFLAAALIRRESWAFRIVDASGKFPSGLLLGNIQWIGAYTECVRVSSNGSLRGSSSIMGGYCRVNIDTGSLAPSSAAGTGLQLGVCLPRTCDFTDAKALVNLLLSFTNVTYATGAACTDDSTLPIDGGAGVVIVILCIFGVFLLLGTCVDVISNRRTDSVANESTDDRNDQDDDPLIDDHSEVIVQSLGTNGVSSEHLRIFPPSNENQPGFLYKFFVSFSVVSNVRRILSTEVSAGNRSLQALHGIRFLSMSWVILGHTYLFTLTNTSNVTVYLEYLKRFTFQAVMNASVSVDTFFVLSGTLVSYFLLKEIKAKEGPHNISWGRFFFHRFWRLTPLYMLTLAFYTTLLKYFGSGPYWQRTSDENCQENWWTNLLYINNIARTSKSCFGWAWYLANDMQFFLLSPLFIVLLYKWALIGFIVIFTFMLASFISIGVITSVNHFPPSMPGMLENVTLQDEWFKQVYIAPWCRINTYLIGIILGYIMYKTNCKLRLPLGLVVLFWVLAAVCNLSVLYGLYNVSRGYFLSSGVSALYSSLHRTVWAIGVAWVILACATGNGGFINDLLSMSVMIPLSRLTYAAYLFHPIVMMWYSLNQKSPLYVDDVTMVYLFIGNLAFSYIMALVISLICEAPLINLEKYFIRDRKTLEVKS